MQLPSASNSAGTFVGTIVGGAILAAGPSWPFVMAAATALGMTPIGFAGLLSVVATAGLNYAVTHYAEARNLNDRLAAWWPLLHPVQSYPGDNTAPPAQSNINPKQ